MQQTATSKASCTGCGACNQWGCFANWGKAGNAQYGLRGAAVDTARPYNVSVSFAPSGSMRVAVAQRGAPRAVYDKAAAGSCDDELAASCERRASTSARRRAMVVAESAIEAAWRAA